nr:MAG TPA: hypothetical protein [Bacteriophage sp.]
MLFLFSGLNFFVHYHIAFNYYAYIIKSYALYVKYFFKYF